MSVLQVLRGTTSATEIDALEVDVRENPRAFHLLCQEIAP